MLKEGWYALYTGYRKEKVVQAQLNKKGITTYLPLLVKTKRYTRKIKQYKIPLISCYVFAYITQEQKKAVLETEFVHGFVSFNGIPASIPKKEIHLMQQIVGKGVVKK